MLSCVPGISNIWYSSKYLSMDVTEIGCLSHPEIYKWPLGAKKVLDLTSKVRRLLDGI